MGVVKNVNIRFHSKRGKILKSIKQSDRHAKVVKSAFEICTAIQYI